MHIQSVDHIHINYEVSGNKQAKNCLVLLHGLGGCVRAFDDLITGLDNQYKIISIDLRAHGQSQRPARKSQYHLNYFLSDIIAVLRAEQVAKPTVIGHCFGGILAMALAASYPNLVNKLILINVSYKAPHLARLIYRFFPLKGVIGLMLRFFPHLYFKHYPDYAKFEKTGDFSPSRISADILHTSFKSYVYMCSSIVTWDLSPQLAAISCPTLIIHGAKDRVFPVRVASELAKHIPHSKVRIIKTAGHVPLLNNKVELARLITKYLES